VCSTATKTKHFLSLLLILFLFASQLAIFQFIPNVEANPGWLTGWSYRKSHVINSASGAGTNYQKCIKVHYGSGTDNSNEPCCDVYLNNHCRTDFGDVRFTKSDGVTELDYWMEEKVDSDYAVFWVEVADDLSSSSATIYIYYGKSDATYTDAQTHGENTFLFFDDFLGTSLNTDKWTNDWTYEAGGTITVADSILKIKAASSVSGKAIKSLDTFTPPYAYRAKVKHPLVTSLRHGMFKSTNTNPTLFTEEYAVFQTADATTHEYTLEADGTNYATDAQDWDNTNFLTWDILRNSNGNSDFYINGTVVDNDHDYSPTDATIIRVVAYKSTTEIEVDWVLIRKYTTPEPSHGSWGTEETPIENSISQDSPSDEAIVTSWTVNFYYTVIFYDTPKNASLRIFNATDNSLIATVWNSTALVNGTSENYGSYTFSTEQTYKWDCIYYNNTGSSWQSSGNYTLTVDVPPRYQNVGSNSTSIQLDETILLYAQGYDGIGLDWAWLATNETGTWKNYTDYGIWEVKTNLTYPVADVPVVTYNGKLYAFGGYDNGGDNPKNYTQIYDPSTDSWTLGADMPTARWGATVSVVDDVAYVFAGAINSSAYTNVCEAYNITANSWSSKTNVPAEIAYQGLMSVPYQGNIYLFYKTYVYMYNVTADSYVQKASSTYSITWATCAIIDDVVYLLGGYDYGTSAASNVVRAYNITSDTWDDSYDTAPYAAWGTTRDNPVINGKIYYGYGQGPSGTYHTKMYEYDPISKTWAQLSNANYDRDGLGCGVVDGNLYCVGGRNQSAPAPGLGWNEKLLLNQYNSPKDMNDIANTWIWVNFTWCNSSITSETTIAWRIYFNDTYGNTNGTDIHYFTIGSEAQEYSYSFTETLKLSVSLSRWQEQFRSWIETVYPSTTMNYQREISYIYTQTIMATETVTYRQEHIRVMQESLASTETMEYVGEGVFTFTQTITPSEFISYLQEQQYILTETTVPTVIFKRWIEGITVFTETFTETLQQMADLHYWFETAYIFTQTVTPSETVTYYQEHYYTFMEPSVLTTTLNVAKELVETFITNIETLNLHTTISVTLPYVAPSISTPSTGLAIIALTISFAALALTLKKQKNEERSEELL